MSAAAPRPRLLVLAAGLGRRFGGAKQIEPVGPEGAWIMDYTIADALRAGFDHVVCVVRPEIREAVGAHLAGLLDGRAGFTLVDQTLRTALPAGVAVPPGRTRPWGTAHAVLAAEPALPGPFAVANADDLYGASSVACLGRALREAPDHWVLVGYPVAGTLSPHGPVSRGLCRVDDEGWLSGVEEMHGVVADGRGGVEGDVRGRTVRLPADAPISMNLWGLDPSVFPLFRRGLAAFLADAPALEAGEFTLPDAVGEAVARGEARVRLLPCGEGWIGMTHPEDREAVRAALEAAGPPLLPGVSDA